MDWTPLTKADGSSNDGEFLLTDDKRFLLRVSHREGGWAFRFCEHFPMKDWTRAYKIVHEESGFPSVEAARAAVESRLAEALPKAA